MAPKKRIMEEFEITEISAVDMPAQVDAKMKVLKRNSGEGPMVEPFSKDDGLGAIAKRYYEPSEGAVSFGEMLNEELKCRNYYAVMEQMYPYLCAMETSLRSIMGDSSIDKLTKLSMMRNAVEDFMGTLRGLWSGADEFMMSALDKMVEGEDTVAKTIEDYKKANAELTEQVEELTKAVAELKAGDGKSTKKKGDKDEAVVALEKKVTELTKSLEESQEAQKAAEEVAKMSASEKAYMDKLSGKAKDEFRMMSAADRKKMMAKAADDDEVIKVDGVGEIRKSAVGETQFAIFKAQQERIEKAEKAAADERSERLDTIYKNRAGEELKHLPGEVEKKAAVLKAIAGLDNDVVETIEKMFEAGEKAISAGFTRFGVNDGTTKNRDTGDAGVPIAKAKFMGKVSEIRKRDACSHQEAMSKARREYPEEFAEYRGTPAE